MRLQKRISYRQKKFVRAVRNSEMSLQEIRAAYNLNNPQITRWMNNQFFYDDLQHAVKEARRLRRLALEVAGNVAISRLGQAARGELALDGWQLNTLIRTAELVEGIRMLRAKDGERARRSASRRAARGNGPEDLCHPSSKERERDLLTAMVEEEQLSSKQGDDDTAGS